MKSVLPFRGDDTLMYSITYDLVTPESAKDGGYEESGYVVEPSEGELQDILLESNRDYGIYKPVGVGVFVNPRAVHDQDYFEHGHEKYYTLTLTKDDGTKLNQEELDFITALLNEGKYTFDSESNRFYDWGGVAEYGIGGWIGGTLIGGFLGYQIGKAVGYGRAYRGYEGGGEIKNELDLLKAITKEFGKAPKGADIRATQRGLVEVYYYSPNQEAKKWAEKIENKYGRGSWVLYGSGVVYTDTAKMEKGGSTYAEGGEIYSLGNSENTGHFGDLYEDDFLRFEEEGKIINLNSDLSADEKGGWHDYFISDDKYANEISKKLISKSGSTYAEGGDIPSDYFDFQTVQYNDGGTVDSDKYLLTIFSEYGGGGAKKHSETISENITDREAKKILKKHNGNYLTIWELENGKLATKFPKDIYVLSGDGFNETIWYSYDSGLNWRYARKVGSKEQAPPKLVDRIKHEAEKSIMRSVKNKKYVEGGEVRYFNRHENMGDETRREILEYTQYPILKEYFGKDGKDSTEYEQVIKRLEEVNYDTGFGGFTNYLYGMFDGFDYTKTKHFQEELAKIKKADPKFHSKIMRIVEEIQSYPTTEQPNNNQFGLGGLLLAGGFGAYVGYKIGRARPQKKGFDTEKKVAKKVKDAVKDVTSKKKPAKAYAGGGEIMQIRTDGHYIGHATKEGDVYVTYGQIGEGNEYESIDELKAYLKDFGINEDDVFWSEENFAGGGATEKEYIVEVLIDDEIDLETNVFASSEDEAMDKADELIREQNSEYEDSTIDIIEVTEIKAGGGETEEVQQYNYLYLKPTSNGLVLELTEEGVQAYNDEEIYEMYDLFEDINSNSEWSYIDNAGDVGLGLTDAPVITDGYYFDDDGEFTDEGVSDSRLYVWNDYMIKDLFDTLMEQGQVTLFEEKSKYYGGGETITKPRPTITPTETPTKPDKDNPYLPKVKPKPKASNYAIG